MPKETLFITHQQAVDALRRYPDLQGDTKDFFLAIIEKTLPNHFLKIFIRLRDEYSDELPDVDVRFAIDAGISEDYKLGRPPRKMCQYKCQGNYVFMLGSNLSQAIEQGIIVDPQLCDEIKTFLASDLRFVVGDTQNHTKLKAINTILRQTIAYLHLLQNTQSKI